MVMKIDAQLFGKQKVRPTWPLNHFESCSIQNCLFIVGCESIVSGQTLNRAFLFVHQFFAPHRLPMLIGHVGLVNKSLSSVVVVDREKNKNCFLENNEYEARIGSNLRRRQWNMAYCKCYLLVLPDSSVRGDAPVHWPVDSGLVLQDRVRNLGSLISQIKIQ